MTIPTIEQLLEVGACFGHKSSKWHPKIKPFIFSNKSGIHIINLKETQKQIASALEFVLQLAQKDSKLLFVSLKKPFKNFVQEKVKTLNLPYVTEDWVPGVLTNWTVIKQQIKKLKKMRSDREKGDWQKYHKKERLKLEEQLSKLVKKFGGIETLDALPEAIFFTDIRDSKIAVLEAKRKKIKSIGICDTNTNYKLVDFPIVCNDDSIKAVEFIVSLVVETYQEGLAVAKKKETADVKTEAIKLE